MIALLQYLLEQVQHVPVRCVQGFVCSMGHCTDVVLVKKAAVPATEA